MPAIRDESTRKQTKVGRKPFHKPHREKYLKGLEVHGLMHLAAKDAGVTYVIVQNYRKKDATFRPLEDAAIKIYQESLVREAVRRGKEGYEQDVYGTLPGDKAGTGVVGKRRVFSDKLLEVTIKRDDAKYREASQYKKVDQTVSGSIANTTIDTSKLNNEEKQQLLALLAKAAPVEEEEGKES